MSRRQPPPACAVPTDCVHFAATWSQTRGCVVLGGGGGDSNTGVPNKIITVRPSEGGASAEGGLLQVAHEKVVGQYEVDCLDISSKNGQLAAGSTDGCKLYVLNAERRVTAVSAEAADIRSQPAGEGAEPEPAEGGAGVLRRKCEQLVFSGDGGYLLAAFARCPGKNGVEDDEQEASELEVYKFPVLKKVCSIASGLEKGTRQLSMSGPLPPAKGKAQAKQRRLVCVNGRDHTCAVWAVDEATPAGLLAAAKTNAAKGERLEAAGALFTSSHLGQLALPPADGAKEQFRGCRFVEWGAGGGLLLLTGVNARGGARKRRRQLSSKVLVWGTDQQDWAKAVPLASIAAFADCGLTALTAHALAPGHLLVGVGGSEGGTVTFELKAPASGAAHPTLSRVCESSGDDMAVTALAFAPCTTSKAGAEGGMSLPADMWLVAARLDKCVVGVRVTQEAGLLSPLVIKVLLALLVALLAVFTALRR